MEFIDLFPTTIYHKILDFKNSEIDSFKETILKQEFLERKYIGNYTKNQKLLDLSIFSKLKQNIIDSSKKYLDNLGHEYEDLQIITSWSPVFKKGEGVGSHSHDNSYLSGVFYLTGGSPIVFHTPLHNLFTFKPQIINTKDKHRSFTSFSYPPRPNSLLIFPSGLHHSVVTSELDERISIAFNIIPKGEFGRNTSKIYL